MKTKLNKLLGGLPLVTLTIIPAVLITLCSNLRAQGIAPPPGLVAWWPGDGNANDIVGTNNGTLMGSAGFVPGEAGQAFSFDGASGYVQVPDANSLNLGGSMTIEAWIKPSVPLSQQTIWAPIVTKFYELSPRNGWTLFTSGTWSTSPGLLSFQITDNCPADSCVSGGGSWQGDLAPTNAFTHLAGVYDQSAGTMALYVNGLLTGQSSIGPYQIGRTTEPLLIGGNSSVGGPIFNGVIDEVTLYSRALSSNEIASIYAAGSAGKCKDPLIIRHPQSQNLYWGQAATFNVGVKGTQPFSYQWLKNGQPITGETTTNLVLTSVQATNAGSYSVIVSNSVGMVTSYPANLSVNVAGVSLALYPGMSIQGLVGQTYGIQYTSDLNNTNSWVAVTNLTLNTPTQIWYDSQPALLLSRFYRVVPGPIPIP